MRGCMGGSIGMSVARPLSLAVAYVDLFIGVFVLVYA